MKFNWFQNLFKIQKFKNSVSFKGQAKIWSIQFRVNSRINLVNSKDQFQCHAKISVIQKDQFQCHAKISVIQKDQFQCQILVLAKISVIQKVNYSARFWYWPSFNDSKTIFYVFLSTHSSWSQIKVIQGLYLPRIRWFTNQGNKDIQH